MALFNDVHLHLIFLSDHFKLWCFSQIFIFLHYSMLLYDGDRLQ